MARPVNYRIHEAAVRSFNAPGQPVYNLIWQVAQTTRTLAKLNTGKRTMTLEKSIFANKPKPEGDLRISSLVGANARHALWHHDGTDAITPLAGSYLVVPRERQGPPNLSGSQLQKAWNGDGKRPTFLARVIRGQEGNPYLADGLETAMARHPNLSFSR